MTTNKKAVQLMVEICRQKGIRHVVFSPGSRSAPLVVAFSAIKEIECLVIPDERVAGYFALGMAQQLKQPVAVVCTSGTAVLNLAPAICEAYYQQVPLLAITADRPEGAVKNGENQSIEQNGVFEKNHVYTFDMNGDEENGTELLLITKYLNSKLEDLKLYPFPHHINVRLSEPLYELTDKKIKHVKLKPLKFKESSTAMRTATCKRIERVASGFGKKLIIVGASHPRKQLAQKLKQLSLRKDVVILSETLSNLSFTKNVVTNIDACLACLQNSQQTELAPEVVVTLGNQIISKKLKQFLQGKPKIHWDVPVAEQYGRNRAMFGSMLDVVEPINELQFLDILLESTEDKESNFRQNWLKLNKYTKSRGASFLSALPLCDLNVFEALVKSFPNGANIQYGNSTPVRYANFFEHSKHVTTNANRGTSGIDGCVSTAAGAAYIHKGLTISVVGDVSFFYDSNTLWNNQLSPNLRIVVINNSGGNIFRLLDGPKKVPAFEKFFETKHQLSAKHLASMFDLPYYICAQQNELEQTLKTFYQSWHKAKILEIKTDGELSAKIYRQYFEHLKKQ